MPLKSRRFIRFGAPYIGHAELKQVEETLKSGWIGAGPRAAKFENAFRSYVGARNVVAVSSGTAALHLALVAAGIGPGDEVVTTPLTFAATVNAIISVGATPVFADVDKATQNLTAANVAKAITARTRAILPVHIAGFPCEMRDFSALARRRKIIIIEDASHAIEAIYHGRHAGTIGEYGCFSFTHNKNITTGEGGAVVTRQFRAARAIRTFAAQGITADAWQRFRRRRLMGYRVVAPGFKYLMADLNAAIGLGQIGQIEKWWRRRKVIWDYYTERFRNLPVFTPACSVPKGRHGLHLFTVHLDLRHLSLTRDEVRRALAENEIGTGVHYVSLHLQPYYRKRFKLEPDDFPNALWISRRTLSLPFSAGLSDAAVERVAKSFRAVIRRATKSTRPT